MTLITCALQTSLSVGECFSLVHLNRITTDGEFSGFKGVMIEGLTMIFRRKYRNVEIYFYLNLQFFESYTSQTTAETLKDLLPGCNQAQMTEQCTAMKTRKTGGASSANGIHMCKLIQHSDLLVSLESPIYTLTF